MESKKGNLCRQTYNGMIELTAQEVEKIKDYTERFLKFKRNKPNYKQGGGSDYEYDRMGFTGEYLVYKYFGRENDFEWEFDKHRRFDDIILKYKNERDLVVDVKTSYTGNELRVAKWHIDDGGMYNVDAFILVKVSRDFKSGEVVGIISMERFKKLAVVKKYNSKCYCLEKGFLSTNLSNLS